MIAKRLTQIAGKGSVARLAATRFGIILRYKLGSDGPERLARRVVEEVQESWPDRSPVSPAYDCMCQPCPQSSWASTRQSGAHTGLPLGLRK